MAKEKKLVVIAEMVQLGGKKVVQMVLGFGGSGVGQALAAVAAALLLRLLSGPGPALSPETEAGDDDNDATDDKGETPISWKLVPVTIQWRNINCSLSDKSSTSVSFHLFNFQTKFLVTYVWLQRKFSGSNV